MSLAIIVVASVLFGLIMPILICIIPQMWRRMHKRDAYDYHTSNAAAAAVANHHTDESHPFISLNNVPVPPRTNLSAARQFNESPSFQRMAVAQSSTSSNHASTALGNHNTNSLSRNR
jgi:hypothetical protein